MKKFNVEIEVEQIIKFIQSYYKRYHLKGAVIGISGGKDSAVSAALFTRALGKENVIGVALPCHSKQTDARDAKLVSEYYGFPLYQLDLTETYDTFRNEFIKNFGELIKEESQLNDSDINLKPRLRMASFYYIGAFFSALKKEGYLVVGNSNKCEKYVGYFTKGGDNVSDIAILSDYTVDEVIQMGEYLKVPKNVLYKEPSDGLCQLTDEDKLGVTYEEIALYMENPDKVKEGARERIRKHHEHNLHKMVPNEYRRKDKMKEIVERLISRKETVSLMESCTGGGLSNAFTSIPGVSEVFHYGVVTYSNGYKIKMGVPQEVIDTYTVYSKETAEAMAKAISDFTNSCYGIGITGKLNLEDPENPMGNNQSVYYSIYNRVLDKFVTKELCVSYVRRNDNKQEVLTSVTSTLLEMLDCYDE